MTQSLASKNSLKTAIKSVYSSLMSQLCARDIRDELFANGIIEMPLKQTIQSKDNVKEANEVLVDHLYISGTVELVEKFIKVLRDTSPSFPIHKEIAEALEKALRVHNVTTQSVGVPRQYEVSRVLSPF